jgi:hypothetical protein
VRELIDGPAGDPAYVGRIQAAADTFRV